MEQLQAQSTLLALAKRYITTEDLKSVGIGYLEKGQRISRAGDAACLYGCIIGLVVGLIESLRGQYSPGTRAICRWT